MNVGVSVRFFAVAATFGLRAALVAAPTGAQTSELALEVGASRVLPPTGVDGDAAAFLVGGMRANRYGVGDSNLHASFLAGVALDGAAGGDFVSAEVGGAVWRSLASRWATGLEGRAFGFKVAEPFSYEAGGFEASAVLRYGGRVVGSRLTATTGVGRSRVTLSEVVQRMRRRAVVTEVLTDDLWRAGGTLEVLAGSDALSAGVAAGAHRSAGGTYRSAGARLIARGGLGALEIRADLWRTPDGSETTGGVAFYIPWGGWTARGTAGKPEPDPLLLAEPGRGAGGVLLGRRVLGRGPMAPAATQPLHQVLEASSGGARVRMTVSAPSGATIVEVLGDFTLWQPVGMAPTGDAWTVELVVPRGTHHFGFLVDGAWYLPDEAPDAVPDEWGRRNATLVIEGQGDPQGEGES